MDAPPLEHAQILIVDDIRENAQLLLALVKARGYMAKAVYGGKEALAEVEARAPDLILLDLVMPGINGIEVCQRLKQSSDTRHIPVIIITGATDREANVHALEAGADDFLVKPFDAVRLEARIRSSLRAKRLQDQILLYQRQLEAHNQHLERCVRERTALLERTQQAAVFSLAKLSESRDVETGAHLDRIRLYVREAALQIAASGGHREVIDDEFVGMLYLSSPLHDIGKVGIPDSILLKPGRLTPDEFEIMKTHAVIGGETLRAADAEAGSGSFLAVGRDIAFYHHERWDGAGYPEGLPGEHIPLAARIVAIADVYDALSSKRPYKEAWPHEKAVQTIAEERGTQFDPVVVDAFLAREGAFRQIRNALHESEPISSFQRLAQKLQPNAQVQEATTPGKTCAAS